MEKAQHYRNGFAIVSVCLVLFLLVSAWHICLYALGLRDLMGFKIYSVNDIIIPFLTGISSLALTQIFLVSQYFKLSDLEKELAISKVSNEISQNTIKILRSHRHDYLNHLQVILGYIQLGKEQSAIHYIKSINASLKDVRAISRIEITEVAVLFFAKTEEAMRHNIKTKFKINTNLAKVKISSFDMVRILSNLIDNSIYELKSLTDKMPKQIVISIDQVGETLFIEVSNYPNTLNGLHNIFDYGYSTKGVKGTGIGLYTVKSLVEEKYGGKVMVNKKDNGTYFNIAI